MMKRKLSLVTLAVFLCLLMTLSTVSHAWFFEGGVSSELGIYSGVGVSYFNSGDGSEAQPYEISTPIQLYNFVWLQNMGNFSGGTVYFRISADIDMAGYTLPPIGIAEYPFVGNLDGGGHTVLNLTVSTYAEDFTDPPVALGDSALTYVGVFGVVGNLDGQSFDISHTGVNSLTLHNSAINGESLAQDDLAGFLDVGVSELQITVTQ